MTKNLGRKQAHRKALLTNLAISLIKHKRITTTFVKAKALKQFIEPIITIGKKQDMNSRRIVFKKLNEKTAVWEVFKNISKKNIKRHGGYTRIIKLGKRLGDGSEIASIELVEFIERIKIMN
ncbi:50S ribosomal protein L17 [Candidatus Karelsulcia muelleri]